MSHKIDPSEVLSYLNELGYTNINSQQLKEFMIDLKKLMKYDQRNYAQEDVENTSPNELPKKGNNCYICNNNEANIFNTLYNQSTVASKAKEVPKKEKHISVHITKSRSCRCGDHTNHIQCRYPVENQSEGTKNKAKGSDQLDFVDPHRSKITVETESTIKSIRPSSMQSGIKSDSSRPKKSKVSFIRPSTSKVNRSDPVALYHHYQSEWKKQKIPGQDNRLDLRWAIREKMLSGPKVEVVGAGGRRRCNSYR